MKTITLDLNKYQLYFLHQINKTIKRLSAKWGIMNAELANDKWCNSIYKKSRTEIDNYLIKHYNKKLKEWEDNFGFFDIIGVSLYIKVLKSHRRNELLTVTEDELRLQYDYMYMLCIGWEDSGLIDFIRTIKDDSFFQKDTNFSKTKPEIYLQMLYDSIEKIIIENLYLQKENVMKKSPWIVVIHQNGTKEEMLHYFDMLINGENPMKEFLEKCGLKSDDYEDYAPEEFISELEISICRKNYKHGQKSFGWANEDKIILFGHENLEFDPDDIEDVKKARKRYLKLIKQAEVMAQVFNEKNL